MASKGEIWLANLNPVKKNNEVGKVRPVLIFQNDDLNKSSYATTIVLPLSTSLINDSEPLRTRISKRDKLLKDSDLLLAQVRSIDNSRLIEKLSTVSSTEYQHIRQLFGELTD